MADESPDRPVFQDMLKPYRAAYLALLPFIGTGLTYGYDIVQFMNRDATHEKQQNENLLTLRKQLSEQEKRLDALRKRHLETLQLITSDLDLLRAYQVRSLPPKQRDRARRDFDAQRARAITLLVEAQKDP